MSRQEVSLYMSEQYFKSYQSATFKANMAVGLLTVLAAFVTTCVVIAIAQGLQVRDSRRQCEDIAKNSPRVTKFTGTTCWIQINDGSDGFGEAWIPSEWMTMG